MRYGIAIGFCIDPSEDVIVEVCQFGSSLRTSAALIYQSDSSPVPSSQFPNKRSVFTWADFCFSVKDDGHAARFCTLAAFAGLFGISPPHVIHLFSASC